MSRGIQYNITPAPTVNPRTAKLALDFIDFSANGAYVKTVDEPEMCVLSHINSPVDAPTSLSFMRSTVKNVYSNRTISEANQAANKAGIKNVVKLDTVLTLVDTADASYRVDIPFSASISFTSGIDPLVTDDVIFNLLSYAISASYSDAKTATTVSSANIARLRRGAMVPQQL
jgi:hypothetical protein